MDVETLGRRERAAGAPVALRSGVWWRRVKPFYAWPINMMQQVRPGGSTPPLVWRLAGYEHAVPDRGEANAGLPVMVLDGVKGYGVASISAKKRNQVRRGLEKVEVRRLVDVGDLVAQGIEINRSALARQAWGGDRSGYLDPRRWRETVEAAHRLGLRESWAAYAEGRLVAYLRAYEVDDTVYITQAMSHSAHLGLYPNDALLHAFLADCAGRAGVERVVFGLECAKPSLNDYKRRFGFETVRLPVYRWLNPAVRVVARWTRYRHYLQGPDGGG